MDKLHPTSRHVSLKVTTWRPVNGLHLCPVLSAIAFVLLLLSSSTWTVTTADEAAFRNSTIRKVYIVAMSTGAPAAAFKDGNEPCVNATTEVFRGLKKLESENLEESKRRHSEHLSRRHLRVLKESGVERERHIYSYTHALNGFAASLTDAEAEALNEHSDVANVQESLVQTLQTVSTHKFLKLDSTFWRARGGKQNAGENVIIGVIDTGIWPEHVAFSDKVGKKYGPPPKKFRGRCATSSQFKACNNKIIGAQFFKSGFTESGYRIDLKRDSLSPRDMQGHGTHTASTAAGNSGDVVTFNGKRWGDASGVAPRARLSIYKALWMASGAREATGSQADLLAAIDQATKDGVDVINYSINGQRDYFDLTELAFLVAAQAGIFISVAAGNSGPGASSLVHTAPWQTIVSASTHDRRYSANVQLGSRKRFVGASLIGYTGSSNRPLVSGKSASLKGKDGSYCTHLTLDKKKVKGNIVLCLRGVNGRAEKGAIVKTLGGSGMIMANDKRSGMSLSSNVDYLPAAAVTFTAGQDIAKYISQTKKPVARINRISTSYNNRAPSVAPFSSRGPIDVVHRPTLTGKRNDLLKPDIAAPGVAIWAAWSPSKTADPRILRYNLIDGTSMAAPHIAGIGALIKQMYPKWSFYAVKSAIQTSASQLDNRGRKITVGESSDATPFDFGSGHVNASGAMDPGLVYDETTANVVSWLMSIDYFKTRTLLQPLPKYFTASYNLNTPNIAVSRISGTVTVTRRVTNVFNKVSTYKAKVVPPKGVSAIVSPRAFTIKPGETKKYTVRFIVRSYAVKGRFTFGSLLWSDGRHVVKSQLAAQPA